MKRTLLPLAAALLFFAACGKKEETAAPPPGQITAAAPIEKPVPGYNNKSTYFKLPGAAGGQIDLASYAGKPVMLMFFTETCPYCRKAAPFVEKVYKGYAAKGLGVVGIALEGSANAPLSFAKELGVTFPLAYGGREISRNYRTQGVPYIYLLTKEHDIYDVWEGYDPSYDKGIIRAVETILSKK